MLFLKKKIEVKKSPKAFIKNDPTQQVNLHLRDTNRKEIDHKTSRILNVCVWMLGPTLLSSLLRTLVGVFFIQLTSLAITLKSASKTDTTEESTVVSVLLALSSVLVYRMMCKSAQGNDLQA